MTKEELCIQACQYAVGELTRKGSSAFITSAHAGRQQISWVEVVEWLKELKAYKEQEPMLDKIRAEINSTNRGTCDYFIVDRIEEIIDKYKAESEE